MAKCICGVEIPDGLALCPRCAFKRLFSLIRGC